MGRVGTAFRAFFRALGDAQVADRIDAVLKEASATPAPTTGLPPAPAPVAPPVTKPVTPPAPKAPAQSEAITLLAALQREGRFVDFLKEDLTGYADAQIGAVARDVHRDCGKVIERFFAPAAVTTTPEGERIAVPTGPEAGNYRLTGKVTGEPPYQGVLQHGGWKATIVEVPAWTGSAETAKLIAPAEVEI